MLVSHLCHLGPFSPMCMCVCVCMCFVYSANAMMGGCVRFVSFCRSFLIFLLFVFVFPSAFLLTIPNQSHFVLFSPIVSRECFYIYYILISVYIEFILMYCLCTWRMDFFSFSSFRFGFGVFLIVDFPAAIPNFLGLGVVEYWWQQKFDKKLISNTKFCCHIPSEIRSI